MNWKKHKISSLGFHNSIFCNSCISVPNSRTAADIFNFISRQRQQLFFAPTTPCPSRIARNSEYDGKDSSRSIAFVFTKRQRLFLINSSPQVRRTLVKSWIQCWYPEGNWQFFSDYWGAIDGENLNVACYLSAINLLMKFWWCHLWGGAPRKQLFLRRARKQLNAF